MTKGAGTRTPFTDKMRARVAKLRISTGWGATSVSKRIIQRKLPGHDHATVGRVLGILNGQAKNTVSVELYDSIINVLQSLKPDEEQLFGHSKDTRRVPLTAEFLEELKKLMSRYHQLSTAKVLILLGAPSDLDANTITRTLAGKQSTLKSTHHSFLLKCFGKVQ